MERACFSAARNRSTAWRLTLPIAVCTGVLCNSSVARAEDTTTTPYPGVTHIRRVTTTQRIHVVVVDLTLETIRLRATRPPGGKTVPTFASDYGVQVAINGDFGTRTAPWKTSGLAMGDGEPWSNTSDNAHEGWIAFGGDNRVELSSPAEILAAPEDWTSETTTADAEGRYSFTHVAAGDVTVTAAAAGYADASIDRYVAAADTTWGSIAMFEPEEAPDAGGALPAADAGAESGGGMDGGCSAAGPAGGWTSAALVLLLLAARRRWRIGLLLLAACHGSVDLGDGEGDADPAPAGECPAPPDLPLVGDDRLPLAAIDAAARPHWGSATHGDGGCSDWSSSKYADWSVYRWAGCHETVYYQIEGSVPSQWHAAIDAAFAAWDVGTLCSPHWQNVTTHPGADARVHVERNGFHCGGGGGVWYACVLRDRASSERDQHWWMNLNDAEHAMGVGVTDALDVQSLVTVELAHIHYLAHMPRFDDSVSTLNNCRWGSTTCRVTAADSCDWSSGDVYDAHCDNCGDRRDLLPGDLATLEHIYGEAADGCATPGEVALACEGCCGADSCGYQTRTCGADHRWSEATCVE